METQTTAEVKVNVSKTEQMELPVNPGIERTKDGVSFLGVFLPFGRGGERVPSAGHLASHIITDYDLRLMQKIAIALELNQPLLIEGGSGISKTSAVDRVCCYTRRECYYANCHDSEPELLIGAKTARDDTISGFGWKDGIVLQAIRRGGVLFLDEYNFMRGETRGRLHEVLDAILRGKNEIILLENDGEVVTVHPDFRIVAAQNPPGRGFTDREVLDPPQVSRFVYIKEPDCLPDEAQRSRFLGALGHDNVIVAAESDYIETPPKAGYTPLELGKVDGVQVIVEQYISFKRSVGDLLTKRQIASAQPQPICLDAQRDFSRVIKFVCRFAGGDNGETFRQALRYYYVYRFADENDREKLEELIAHMRMPEGKAVPRNSLDNSRNKAEPESSGSLNLQILTIPDPRAERRIEALFGEIADGKPPASREITIASLGERGLPAICHALTSSELKLRESAARVIQNRGLAALLLPNVMEAAKQAAKAGHDVALKELEKSVTAVGKPALPAIREGLKDAESQEAVPLLEWLKKIGPEEQDVGLVKVFLPQGDHASTTALDIIKGRKAIGAIPELVMAARWSEEAKSILKGLDGDAA